MPKRTILHGNGRIIEFWWPSGELEPEDYCGCPGIGRKEKLKIVRICKTFIATGRFPRSDTKFKGVKGFAPLCAIKPDKQIRLLGYLCGGLKRFVIVLGLRKKKNKHNRGDLDRALSLVNQHKQEQK